MPTASHTDFPFNSPQAHAYRNKIKKQKRWILLLTFISIFLFLFLGYNLWDTNKSFESIHSNQTELKTYDSIKTTLIEKFNLKIEELDARLSSLPKSFNELRQNFLKSKHSFSIGMTSKVGVPLNLLTGDEELTSQDSSFLSNQSKQTKQLIAKEAMESGDGDGGDAAPFLRLNGKQLNPKASSLDLRRYITIPNPRDQLNTKSCWAFSAASSYETVYLINFNRSITVSPQYIINCSNAGTSFRGGNTIKVYAWMIDQHKNLENESKLPYFGLDDVCPDREPTTNYYAVHWALVDVNNDPNAIPPIDSIKTRLCQYGPISASMTADENYPAYDGGVISGTWPVTTTNHAIIIIGWDDGKSAWLCKNSYGTNWGEKCGFGNDRGYFWIDYKSFNIGRKAAWIVPTIKKS